MNLFKMDREIEYEGKTYKVIEEMPSGYLLVVDKEATFPAPPVIIPKIGAK